MRLHHHLHGGVCFFCMTIGFYFIMVMPKRLAARSSTVEYIHFCIWNGFSWIDAVLLLRSFSLDDLLQNGTFKSEFGVRNRRFGWNTWTCLIFVTVITARDDLVPYWEDSALSASTTSLLVEVEVFDLYWFHLLWCPSSSIELNLDIALWFGHLVSIVYIYSWWFCIARLFGDFNEILRIDFAGDCVM
jgi:hypothetical protein